MTAIETTRVAGLRFAACLCAAIAPLVVAGCRQGDRNSSALAVVAESERLTDVQAKQQVFAVCPSGPNANHGKCVNCAAHTLNDLLAPSLINPAQRDSLQGWFAETGCACSPSGGVGQTGTACGLVGAAGGSFASADGVLTVTIPAGALTSTIPFTIRPVTGLPAGNIGAAYDIEPSGSVFQRLVELKFAYNPALVPGTDATAVAVGTVVAGVWEPVNLTAVDPTSHTAAGFVLHFSPYGVVPASKSNPTSPPACSCTPGSCANLSCRKAAFAVGTRGDVTESCSAGQEDICAYLTMDVASALLFEDTYWDNMEACTGRQANQCTPCLRHCLDTVAAVRHYAMFDNPDGNPAICRMVYVPPPDLQSCLANCQDQGLLTPRDPPPQCPVACSLGLTLCGARCVDLTSDRNNCGACGKTCAAGTFCGNGDCVAACASGQGCQCSSSADCAAGSSCCLADLTGGICLESQAMASACVCAGRPLGSDTACLAGTWSGPFSDSGTNNGQSYSSTGTFTGQWTQTGSATSGTYSNSFGTTGTSTGTVTGTSFTSEVSATQPNHPGCTIAGPSTGTVTPGSPPIMRVTFSRTWGGACTGSESGSGTYTRQ